MNKQLKEFISIKNNIPINKVKKPINGKLLIKEGDNWNELESGPFALLQYKKTQLVKNGTKKENLKITY
jgi:hypothetical protein